MCKYPDCTKINIPYFVKSSLPPPTINIQKPVFRCQNYMQEILDCFLKLEFCSSLNTECIAILEAECINTDILPCI